MNNFINKNYTGHIVFSELKEIADFYNSLSDSIMYFILLGTKIENNLDAHIFSSMHGTLDSIRDVLLKGRINDAYALLRKYYDSTFINVYLNLYLKNNYSIDNLIVKQIDKWIEGIETIPEYRIISSYIKNSCLLKPITLLLDKDKRYKKIRERCNDNTHYNFFHNVLSNDNEIYNPVRLKMLDLFSSDLNDIFIQHFSYVFYLNDHYMMSSDYIDALDNGISPGENSQYLIAPFIQDIFDTVIIKKRNDIAVLLKNNSRMKIE
ncbi:MAG: hypothetical protein PHU47_01285 [Candidatus ainarchaeum sp.]|nr:hypothetical protein [Candidatus ainarchaeum sp.]